MKPRSVGKSMAHAHPKATDSNERGRKLANAVQYSLKGVDICFDCVIQQLKYCPRNLDRGKCEAWEYEDVYMRWVARTKKTEGVAA